jgi:SlyX protein
MENQNNPTEDNETNERFIALEMKVAYMEDFINKLQEVCVENQKTIEILRQENKILSGRIQDLSDNIEIPNRKPPHY